jgi:hypothetical protein
MKNAGGAVPVNLVNEFGRQRGRQRGERGGREGRQTRG